MKMQKRLFSFFISCLCRVHHTPGLPYLLFPWISCCGDTWVLSLFRCSPSACSCPCHRKDTHESRQRVILWLVRCLYLRWQQNTSALFFCCRLTGNRGREVHPGSGVFGPYHVTLLVTSVSYYFRNISVILCFCCLWAVAVFLTVLLISWFSL